MNTTIQKSFTIAGISFAQSTAVDSSNGAAVDPTVPVAQASTLTTRGSVSAGTLTMTSGGHGIITGQRMDLYWAGGRRRGATVGTVSGTSVPFTGGSGTDLPSTSTAIAAATPLYRPLGFVGDDLDLFGVKGPAGGHTLVVVVDASNVELTFYHNQGGVVQEYFPTFTDTNPFAGVTVAGVWVSHDNTSATGQVCVGAMCN